MTLPSVQPTGFPTAGFIFFATLYPLRKFMSTKKLKDRLLIAQEAYTVAQEEWQTASAKYYEARRKYMKLLDEKFERDNKEQQ